MSSSVASINVDQAGGVTATLLAAKAGYRIVVVGMCLAVGGAAITVKSTFQDETSNTVRMTVVGNATTPVVYAQGGGHSDVVFQCGIGEGLELVTGTASAITGTLQYQYVQ